LREKDGKNGGGECGTREILLRVPTHPVQGRDVFSHEYMTGYVEHKMVISRPASSPGCGGRAFRSIVALEPREENVTGL